MKLSFNIKSAGMVIAVSAVVLSSCKKDPSFVTPVTEGAKPAAAFTNTSGSLAISFTNTSVNLQSSYWQFGDGDTSSAASPAHTYAVAGKYTVTLKVVSDAGYADVFSKTITAAVPAVASFTSATAFATNVLFTNTSTSVDTTAAVPYLWDFGDGSATSTSKNPDHKFAAYGTYNVKLRVIGLLGDTAYITKAVNVVDDNLLLGGSMELTDAPYWTSLSSQTGVGKEFGYTGDKPTAGYNGCFRFKSYANSGGTSQSLIYQAVSVTVGKKYYLSAQIKLPSGSKNCYFHFYISTSASSWVESTNMWMGFNTWHGWSSTAVDGDLMTKNISQGGSYGVGAATSDIYTATTSTIYIGIQAGTWQGSSNGDYLIDNVRFVQVN